MQANVQLNPKALPGRKRKKPTALELACEQYQRLREELPATPDIAQKNKIFRRLINLLDVMDFLNAHDTAISH